MLYICRYSATNRTRPCCAPPIGFGPAKQRTKAAGKERQEPFAGDDLTRLVVTLVILILIVIALTTAVGMVVTNWQP